MVSLRYFCLSGVSHTVSATTALTSASKFCRKEIAGFLLMLPTILPTKFSWLNHNNVCNFMNVDIATPRLQLLKIHNSQPKKCVRHFREIS